MEFPEVRVFECVEIRRRSVIDRLMGRRLDRLLIDGVEFAYQAGAWACWVPKLCLKFLYSIDGNIHCTYPAAPSREFVLSNDVDPEVPVGDKGIYNLGDWRTIYQKKAEVRLAEVFIASRRLFEAGLGPKPMGVFIARNYIERERVDNCGVVGIFTEDATKLPSKRDATEDEILKAGVSIDRIKSCVRQQVNGYVVDLNSVVGVVPFGASDEVEVLSKYFLENSLT